MAKVSTLRRLFKPVPGTKIFLTVAALVFIMGAAVTTVEWHDQRSDITNNNVKLSSQIINKATFLRDTTSTHPELILLVGLLLSLFLAILLFILMISITKHLVKSKDRETQEAADELVSLASHQLRTPATAVKQYIGMILEGYLGKVSAEQLKALNRAYASNERQLELINQLLYITRADADRLILEKEEFDLNKLIAELISEFIECFKDLQQKIIFNPGDAKLLIFADKNSIRMVVENLLTNASKYTHKGGTISVRTSQSKDSAIITVKDNGVGIRRRDMQKLFKKFVRIDNELSIQAGGSGIGLYLDKTLVDLHGGHIYVTSNLGKGSTFQIKIPLKANDLESPKSP